MKIIVLLIIGALFISSLRAPIIRVCKVSIQVSFMKGGKVVHKFETPWCVYASRKPVVDMGTNETFMTDSVRFEIVNK